MQGSRVAVIDIGTNTLKMLVAQVENGHFEMLHKAQINIRLGADGLSQGLINMAAQDRLEKALSRCRQIWQEAGVPKNQVFAFATSAFRNAKNGPRIAQMLKSQFGFSLAILSGEEEVSYMCCGVAAAVGLGSQNALLMDIGGGSVEWAIANERKVLWKKSFEVGGQRLMEQYIRQDPMQDLDIQRLDIYLETQLIRLSEAVFRYSPKLLIGAAGTFDTLAALDFAQENGADALPRLIDEAFELKTPHYEMDYHTFEGLFQKIVRSKQSERLAMPGMPPFRADMIVPASCLVRFVMEQYELETLQVSAYGLKEGYLLDCVMPALAIS
ncbi:MAG: exopolyphosphatase [Microscillaceae bacterium]|nr:exopolyphosphatase [Microscillaceae bacterium]